MTKTDLAELKAYYATFEQIGYPHTAIISLIESYERALAVIEYYGSTETWYLLEETYSIITDQDLSKVDLPFARRVNMGGKKARYFLRSVGNGE